MTEVLTCPSCGAPLEYRPEHGSVVRCEYCETPIVLPEALQREAVVPAASATVTTASIPMPGLRQLLSLKEVAQLAREGRQEEAMALFQENLGVDAAEAQRVVSAMAGSQPVMLSSQAQINLPGITTIGRPQGQAVRTVQFDLQGAIRKWLIWGIVIFVIIFFAVFAGAMFMAGGAGP
ncbi:MAG: hypothetical protein JXA37_09985 [Chloroflexia bacterium]|nr:hypothetical protein [Chloroflexia bacterium]